MSSSYRHLMGRRLRRLGLRAPLLLLSGGLLMAALAHPAEAQIFGGEQDYLLSAPRTALTVDRGLLDLRANGQVFDFTTREFDVDRGDFRGGSIGLTLGIWLDERLDVLAGVSHSDVTLDHVSRNFEELDGSPIRQSTRVRFGPAVQAGLALFPLGRGETLGTFAWVPRTLAPFVSGGIGVGAWEFRQYGDFVDEDPPGGGGPVIFADDVSDNGTTFLRWLGVGVDVALFPNSALVFMGQYHWAESDFGSDFILFDPIDLSAVRFSIGISLRL